MELDEMAEAAVAAVRSVIGGPREHWKDDREIDETLARIDAEVRKRLGPALAAVAAEVRQAEDHRAFAVRLARGVEVSWRETVVALAAAHAAQTELAALRAERAVAVGLGLIPEHPMTFGPGDNNVGRACLCGVPIPAGCRQAHAAWCATSDRSQVRALRSEVERLRAAAGTVVRGAAFGDGTAEVDGQALVDLAAARLPRVRPPEPVEVDEDAVGDLPRGPVMP